MKRVFAILLIGINLLFFPGLILSQPVDIGIDISVTVPGEPWSPPGPTTRTKIILKGKAYPDALITFLKNEEVAATFFAEETGLFEKEITGIRGGEYDFGIWAEDTDGRKSVTLNFTVTVLSGKTTTISGIFIPPTIEINPIQVEKGQTLDIFGQSFPESEINLFIYSKEIVEKTKTSLEGYWLYKLSTDSLEIGEHEVKAKAFCEDSEQSEFSQTLSFLIFSACWGADLNFDRGVDVIDFSILLYFWEQTEPENRCADINVDKMVDVFDFSIMMYEWTD